MGTYHGVRTWLVAGLVGLLGSVGEAWSRWDEGAQAYERGDYTAAFQEMRPLAEQGHAKAQFNLGLMYAKGQGVPQDYLQAYVWYSLAAARFLTGADRDTAVQNRDEVAVRLRPVQLADAQARVHTWQPKPETITGR